MFQKTNIEERLASTRRKRVSENDILKEFQAILSKNEEQREVILKKIESPNPSEEEILKKFKFELLETNRIYHIDDIEKLCVTYRLRFLDSHFFKGEIPEEAISIVRRLEKEHQFSRSNFKIVAPAKLLKLENADDPLLFAPMGNDYFYLIHKWGNDLHPFRKALMWPYKNFENLIFTIFLVSIFLTAITPIHLFTKAPATQEYLLLFLFMFKAVGGVVLFYGFAKGKNFNNAIWNSKYYNA